MQLTCICQEVAMAVLMALSKIEMSKGLGRNLFAADAITDFFTVGWAEIITIGIFFVRSLSFNFRQISLPSLPESKTSRIINLGKEFACERLSANSPFWHVLTV